MFLEATPIAWHNGKLVEREQAVPSIASHSLRLGLGVFDGIVAYWNGDRYYIHCLESHLDRLRNSSTNIASIMRMLLTLLGCYILTKL